jgi:hypothetical protein
VAKGSESPSWKWSHGLKQCAGCDRTLKVAEVTCWHTANKVITVWCNDCYPRRWAEYVRATVTNRGAGVAPRQASLGHTD